jgi:glycerol-3-phosphate dehydrogenase subunit B
LTAAWRLAARGKRVKLLTKGWGATHWGSGCVDVLGCYPLGGRGLVESPLAVLETLTRSQPSHPYARLGTAGVETALQAFQDLCAEVGYPLEGSLERNHLLPTALGAPRPTCLAPATFTAGDLRGSAPMLLVGIAGFHDFSPHLAAANLRAQGIPAEAVIVNPPALAAHTRRDAMTLARLFDTPAFRAEIADSLIRLLALTPRLGRAERIGFPAVLGLRDSLRAVRDLESLLGRRVFEIPGLPPSVPGLRLHHILLDAIRAAGGRVFTGMEAVGSQRAAGKRIEGVWIQSAARPTLHRAQTFILATGGFLGGGFQTDFTGYAQETVFDLPLKAPAGRLDWFRREFLHPQGHPIFQAGLRVGADFRTGLENVYAVGSALAGDFLRERSLEGVALATGIRVGAGLSDG